MTTTKYINRIPLTPISDNEDCNITTDNIAAASGVRVQFASEDLTSIANANDSISCDSALVKNNCLDNNRMMTRNSLRKLKENDRIDPNQSSSANVDDLKAMDEIGLNNYCFSTPQRKPIYAHESPLSRHNNNAFLRLSEPDDAYFNRNCQNSLKSNLKYGNPLGFSRQIPTANSPPETPTSSCRFDNSLGLLTQKFVQMLKDSHDGVLDLNLAATALGVQKRRIYDITNVLEGIGLIIKKSKNNVQIWLERYYYGPVNFAFSSDAQKQGENLDELKEELLALKREEVLIEQHTHLVQEMVKSLFDSDSSKSFAYVTNSDIRGLQDYSTQTLLAIKSPNGATIDVPAYDESSPTAKYEIQLSSKSGPIEVLLIQDLAEAATKETQITNESEKKVFQGNQATLLRGQKDKNPPAISNPFGLSPSFLYPFELRHDLEGPNDFFDHYQSHFYSSNTFSAEFNENQFNSNIKSNFNCALKQTVSRNAPESIIKQTWKADASITKNYEECGLKIKLNEDLKKKTALTQQNEESPEEAKPCVEALSLLASSSSICKKKHYLSQNEKKYIEILITAHGDDIDKMFKDIKLNNLQKTRGQIVKMLKAYKISST